MMRGGEVGEVLIETYAANDRMNQWLLAHLDPRAWRAKPDWPRGGRTIAAVFAHMHNCRRTWLRLSAPHLPCPPPLDPAACTMKQAAAAHRKSAAACLRMLKEALADPPGRVTRFARDGYCREWPAGASMFAYIFAHDAHHRGQILHMAHQLGFRFSAVDAGGIWQWDRLWKELGFPHGPR